MSSLVDIIFNIELSLVVGTLTSLILGLLLLLIKVPGTAYYKKIANTKNTIAVCYLICSVLFFATLRYSGISDYDVFSSLMMFVITATASVVLSYSLITLLEPGDFDHDKFYLNVGAVAVMSFILAKSFWWEDGFGKIAVMSVSLFLFIIQCLGHIVKFRKTYLKSVKQLEMYYDEEEDTKIRWIKFCYIIMMLTQTFILVYMLLPRGMMKIYTLCYPSSCCIFQRISYLSSEVINFFSTRSPIRPFQERNLLI